MGKYGKILLNELQYKSAVLHKVTTHVTLRIHLAYCNLIMTMIKLLHILRDISEICMYEKMSSVYAVFAN